MSIFTTNKDKIDSLTQPVAAMSPTPPEKPVMNSGCSKFTEFADRMAKTQKAWIARADEQAAKLNTLEKRADTAFAKTDANLSAYEAGIKDMESMVKAIEGNGPPATEPPFSDRS